jgi:hypothetical protein
MQTNIEGIMIKLQYKFAYLCGGCFVLERTCIFDEAVSQNLRNVELIKKVYFRVEE